MWYCVRCHLDYDLNVWVCSHCGFYPLTRRPSSRLGASWGEPGLRPTKRRRPKTADLATLEARHVVPRLVRFGFEDLRLPLPTAIAVEGPPGQGKSTLATCIALDLAAQRNRVLYLSSEEGVGPSALHRFKRTRLNMGLEPPPGLLIADVATPMEAQEELDQFRATNAEGLIVVDSLTDLDPSAGMLQGLVGDDRFGVVLVMHLTTGGVPRGGLEPLYAVDVWLTVRELTATIKKSRWGVGGEFGVLAPARWDQTETGAVVELPREKP